MAIRDLNAQRLFVDAALVAGVEIGCAPDQANYLRNVLRLGAGATILVFNGRDGEWRADVVPEGRRGCKLVVGVRTRGQEAGPDLDYLFAPLKRARLDYMVQKATEMGVARLRPVLTRRTQADRVNLQRMRANAIEAAEQCGILRIPQVQDPVPLERALEAWEPGRLLVFCDEGAEQVSPLAALSAAAGAAPAKLAVLIGPEGGFDEAERAALLAHPSTLSLSLGPRIMRADTAAVAALALVEAVLGDWR